jgi:hypothetical protein
MTQLELSGLAGGPARLAFEQIVRLPGVVEDSTSLIGRSLGRAAPLASIIAVARPGPEARFCSVVSADGTYSASIPLDDLARGGWLAFGGDGAPAAGEAGGPLRLVVADGDTLCWNVKDVGELRFTADKEPDSVPARPTH